MRGPEIPGPRDWHASFVYPSPKQHSILPISTLLCYTYTHTYIYTRTHIVYVKIKLKDI